VEKKGARVRARELYLAYRRFAEQGGEFPITETAFGLKLKGKGFEKVRSNGLLWVGLELLP
jgi:phage/plasmid-associated DNA primase